MLIYCLDDDMSILELITYTLKQTGFAAEGFTTGTELFKALDGKRPDLIILDIMLEGMSGLEILQKLRQTESMRTIPIIMATAKGTEFDKVYGLDSGADDYLVKPFGMMELVSRVRALLRRTELAPAGPSKQLVHKNIVVDQEKHHVYCDAELIYLTVKEFQLLEMLIKNQGTVLSRELLLNKVWGYDFGGETRTVDVHIHALRKKLHDDGSLIKTVHGLGYTLI